MLCQRWANDARETIFGLCFGVSACVMAYYVFECFLQITVRVFVCFCLVVAPYGGKIVGKN